MEKLIVTHLATLRTQSIPFPWIQGTWKGGLRLSLANVTVVIGDELYCIITQLNSACVMWLYAHKATCTGRFCFDFWNKNIHKQYTSIHMWWPNCIKGSLSFSASLKKKITASGGRKCASFKRCHLICQFICKLYSPCKRFDCSWYSTAVFPLRPYVAKLAQHFEKLAQRTLWERVKRMIFLDNLAHFSQS